MGGETGDLHLGLKVWKSVIVYGFRRGAERNAELHVGDFVPKGEGLTLARPGSLE